MSTSSVTKKDNVVKCNLGGFEGVLRIFKKKKKKKNEVECLIGDDENTAVAGKRFLVLNYVFHDISTKDILFRKNVAVCLNFLHN